jgi:hypothetical protein
MGCQSNRYQYSQVPDSWHKTKGHICRVSVSPHGVQGPGKLGYKKNFFCLQFVTSYGFDKLTGSIARNYRDFVQNLDNLEPILSIRISAKKF